MTRLLFGRMSSYYGRSISYISRTMTVFWLLLIWKSQLPGWETRYDK